MTQATQKATETFKKSSEAVPETAVGSAGAKDGDAPAAWQSVLQASDLENELTYFLRHAKPDKQEAVAI
jgi:hypothetical protein